jgi:hypothetical protein
MAVNVKTYNSLTFVITIFYFYYECLLFWLTLYHIFLDFNKEYDRVDHVKLWEILETNKIPKNLINNIKSLCINTKLCVPMDKETEKCTILKVNKGLRQGCC